MKLVTGVMLALASTLLVVVSLEGALRLREKWHPRIVRLDDEIGWVHSPDVRRRIETEDGTVEITTNPLGLRGPLPPDSEKTRVLILGDSFADGLEVSDVDLLSVRLQEARPDLAVYNGGVMGYSTVQERLLLDRLRPVVDPAIVLLLVYANDLHDNVRSFSPAVGPRPYLTIEGSTKTVSWRDFARSCLLPIPGAEWIYRKSKFYQFVHARAVRMGLLCSDSGETLRTDLPYEVKWNLLETAIGSFPRVGVTIVGVPHKEEVISGRADFVNRLGTMTARLGFSYINVQPVLVSEDFLGNDIHWRASGHRAVAALLADSIAAGS